MVIHSASSLLRQPLTIASILFLVLLATPWHLSFGQDEDVNRVLQNLSAGIKAVPPGHAREDRAEDMLRYVAKLEKSTIAAIDDQTIDKIAELLLDPSDLVRSCAAATLGYFRARSRRALPALRHALSEAERELEQRMAEELIIILPSRHSIPSIEAAIFFIEQTESDHDKNIRNRNIVGQTIISDRRNKTQTTITKYKRGQITITETIERTEGDHNHEQTGSDQNHKDQQTQQHIWAE